MVQQARGFCSEVTIKEMDHSTKGIGVDKSPRLDGFNSFFFRKYRHILMEDLFNVVSYFFKTEVVCKSWNITSIILVPKKDNAKR